MARPPTKRSAGAAGLDEAHVRRTMRKHCNDVLGIKHEPILDEELLDDSVYEPPSWTDMAEIRSQSILDGDLKASGIRSIDIPITFEDKSLNACLEVLQHTQPDRDLYSSAVREILQHARASTDQAKSVTTALRRILTRDKLDPIVSALNEVTCCHQAVSLAATVSALSNSTPSTLRNALIVFYEALPPNLRTSLPEVLSSMGRNTTATTTNSTYAPSHDSVDDSRGRFVDGVGATPKQKHTAVAKIPVAVYAGPPPNAPTAPRSQQAHRNSLHASSHTKAEMARRPSTSADLISFINSSRHPPHTVMYTVNTPHAPSSPLTSKQLKAACATRLGQRNIARAEKLSDHIWTVSFIDQQTASKALTTSIDIHGIVHTADYIYLKPPKAFTWRTPHPGVKALDVGRRLQEVFAAPAYPGTKIRWRRVEREAPSASYFFIQFTYAPRLFSFFLPIETAGGVVTAWFKPIDYMAPCPLCGRTDHGKGGLCGQGKVVKGLGEGTKA
ncbi:hypothetical protein LTR91_024439 [Friedmanniomyces endolithicus]|uniref:Uncharacterized protein n=1 Tax=Friedmanniomyces endolithicus TaxID=329885 RepID=A0AAN6H4B5_9PEZI|nr:hypothetical protein LTR94_009271 [Friedmanniomyces endolithicus]KAK0797086.1 hypothetical protein LTR59_006931 [Friedmanniomyces endolithicus]KAK0797988.1 hypothetical protein LTR38_007982 [Friedmanniomyces endolithicus]KAK0813658.1 hypothetical protein LTR75_004471 [Friedmanniomyces endolithicus]KAK0850068.1 hypothetical protein LTR03_004782 [Friedmanniomyces endolithicus]